MKIDIYLKNYLYIMNIFKILSIYVSIPFIIICILIYNILYTEDCDDVTESPFNYYIAYYTTDYTTDYDIQNDIQNIIHDNITCDNIFDINSFTYAYNKNINTESLLYIILNKIKNIDINYLNILKCDYMNIYMSTTLNKPVERERVEYSKIIRIYFHPNIIWNNNYINTSYIKQISLFDYGIVNISFLNSFINLNNLDLSFNTNIKNLERLYIKTLHMLRLQNMNIKEIKIFNKLINLKDIDLSYNKNILDIDIFYIPGLESISLRDCNLDNIIFLNKFKKLEYLELSDNKHINSSMLNALYIPTLEILMLNNCNITNTYFINMFKSLEYIDLSNNEMIRAISNVSSHSLKKLFLRNTGITNIKNINNFINLISLDLSHNTHIRSLNKLNIPSLKKLYLRNCSIVDVNNIININNLYKLDLSLTILINKNILKIFTCNASHLYYNENICNYYDAYGNNIYNID